MIELGILDTINDNDYFREGFCRDCDAITKIKATRTSPEESVCPCDFDIGDDLCIRQDDYMTIVEIVDELNGAIRDVCNG